MPRLSDTMEEGVILSWLKNIGDPVEPGDVLAEIETDKAVMELEAYDKGILERVFANEGDRVPVGVPIAVIGDGSGTSGDLAAQREPAARASATTAADVPPPSTAARATAIREADRPKASPLARKIAAESGIDLKTVTGSGPGGRIVRKDIETAAASDTNEETSIETAGAVDDFDEIPLTTLQRVAAKRLTESKQSAPHFYLTATADVTELIAFREMVNQSLQAADGSKVSVNDFLVRAVAVALRTHPRINVSFHGDGLRQYRRVHIGVAVAVDAGLVVPVIRDADRKAVSEISCETKELAGRARSGKLRVDEMSGSTFTISNLGMYGIEQFAAVINPPEAAILAVGAATEKLCLIDGEVVARKVMRLTLSSDHRAIDGSTGAVFLQDLTKLLEHPLQLVV